MQQAMTAAAASNRDIILLSPTGSGKTLAFLIPLLKALKPANGRVQAVVIAPSRELASQIFGITQSIAAGHKVSCCFGGHNVIDEKRSLEVAPSIIIATPGRLLDHLNREHIDVAPTRILVLDEFDKSLELGFHDEMRRIVKNMPNVSTRFLTSATMIEEMPEFLKNFKPTHLNFLGLNEELSTRTTVHRVVSPMKDKLQSLKDLLHALPLGKTIVFVNYRESVDRVTAFLKEERISCGAYHGALEQGDREKALAMFNNGSFVVLVTTDLAARGLDISGIEHIIHYHIPVSAETYTHRNGRTARYSATGNVYVITSQSDSLPEYITFDTEFALEENALTTSQIKAGFSTLHFLAGRKEKLSKGDIAGFLSANSGLQPNEIGRIDLFDHYALAAIPHAKAKEVLARITPLKIKAKKVRITLLTL